MTKLVPIITSKNPMARNSSIDEVCRGMDTRELLRECEGLDLFRRLSDNLYHRVRALFFLHAIHRYYLPMREDIAHKGLIPFEGYAHLLKRRFEEAIEVLLEAQKDHGPSDSISSALASAYHDHGFQTLADQVRRSVRSVRGNQWMFRMGHPADHPLRIRPELLNNSITGAFPVLRECTPVRMDLSHSGWSDIFFLGMDYPEGARVLNVSIDLGVYGRDRAPKPPVEAYIRVLDQPVLKLSSADLGVTATITSLSEVFDFAKDYLGLLKAAVIASGLVPPGIEGSGQSLVELLAKLVGPGLGLEIISNVNNIPKGSRLAVSTSLLGSLITVCMRATGQAKKLTGSLEERERQLVAARAILGEWLAGSGGGWQDSGGIWPGVKLIQGVLASEDDPEFGISRGRLLPSHRIFSEEDAPTEARFALQESLVLVHGGMAQNVGPILEMVTERYLLRKEPEWSARQEAIHILDEILGYLKEGNIKGIASATTRNFFGPIQTIIPWATNLFTETLIGRVAAEFGGNFWGFWMLGGMSGGGMGFIFAPGRKEHAQNRLLKLMLSTKRELECALPFAMNPVVYDFSINDDGTKAQLLDSDETPMPRGYYTITIPELIRMEPRTLSHQQRDDLHHFGSACRTNPELSGMVETMFDRLVPQQSQTTGEGKDLQSLLDDLGFDRTLHEQIRDDLIAGRIGLAQNHLPANSDIHDVEPGDVFDMTPQFDPDVPLSVSNNIPAEISKLGEEAISAGQVAVLTLAAGVGSRWTQGAGVVKALNPFCKLGGEHRNFIEVHLAKSLRTSSRFRASIPHIFSTSYLTHNPIEKHLERVNQYGYPGQVVLSPGRSVGLRLIPMVRDLRFMWEEMQQQLLDEQAQKVRDSLRSALVQWAVQSGEGSDYTDNIPIQCLHPVGHWTEVPNLLRNGVMQKLLDERPHLKHLLVHNIDTLGADIDPGVLGYHIHSGACLTFEVIPRRLEDRGGGLARVDDRVRLVEGLAMPHERDEFRLSFYNTNTTWIDIDKLLHAFGLNRTSLSDETRVTQAVRSLASRMPTYITLKEVKERWGNGQEDIFPVAQFEKLWGDMTSLPELHCAYALVARMRGQQLKDPSQLDGWLRDGSAVYVESLCEF